MEKSYDIKKYVESVRNYSDFFKRYYFHSIIDLNLVKMDSILSNGILSKRLIEQQNLIGLYTHSGNDIDSKNGNTFVSLSEYVDDCVFSLLFDSFALHTLTSVSVLVNKDINVSKSGERETFFDDEVFCQECISTKYFEGILLPKHLSNLKISEVSCLPNDLHCYTKRYINRWIEYMEFYFNRTIPRDEILKSVAELWSILSEFERPERWVASALVEQQKQYGEDLKDVLAKILHRLWQEKLCLENPSYMDVLSFINHDELPIYEIQEKGLKRVRF